MAGWVNYRPACFSFVAGLPVAAGWGFGWRFLYAACLHAGLQYLPHGVKKLCCFPQFSHGFLYMIHLFFLYLISSPCPPPVATLAAFFMALFVCFIDVFFAILTAVKRLTTTTQTSPLNSFVWASENWRLAAHPRPALQGLYLCHTLGENRSAFLLCARLAFPVFLLTFRHIVNG